MEKETSNKASVVLEAVETCNFTVQPLFGKDNKVEESEKESYQQIARVLSSYRNMPFSFYANTSSGVHTGFYLELHSSVVGCVEYLNGSDFIEELFDPAIDGNISDLKEKMLSLFAHVAKFDTKYRTFKK